MSEGVLSAGWSRVHWLHADAGPGIAADHGYILLALALPVLAWAVLGDPSRGRLRCPKCWYRMEGIPKQETGWICPECGRKIAKERGLKRARRRWRWAVPALLAIMVASQMWQQPARANERWQTRWIPTTALVIAPTRAEWLSCINEAARARRGSLPGWVWLMIDGRDWRRAIRTARSLPYTRERWPVGVEPVIWLRDADSIQGLLGSRRDLILEEIETGRSWRYSPFYGYMHPIPGMSPTDGLRASPPGAVGPQKYRIRVVLSDGTRRYVLEELVEYTAVESIDAAIMPASPSGIEVAVRSAVQAKLSPGGGVLSIWMGAEFAWGTFDCSIVSDVGQQLAAGENGEILVRMEGLSSDRLISTRGMTDPSTRIVFRQDPILVLQRYPNATSYWPGTVEIPFSELLPR